MKRALHLILFLFASGAAFASIPRVDRDVASGLGVLMGVQPSGGACSGVRRQSSAPSGTATALWLKTDWRTLTEFASPGWQSAKAVSRSACHRTPYGASSCSRPIRCSRPRWKPGEMHFTRILYGGDRLSSVRSGLFIETTTAPFRRSSVGAAQRAVYRPAALGREPADVAPTELEGSYGARGSYKQVAPNGASRIGRPASGQLERSI